MRFTTSTHLEYLPDNSNWAAFVHGPIVLAAKTSTADLVGLFADDSRMGHETKGKLYPIDKAYTLIGDADTFTSKVKPVGQLKFSLDSLMLQPFYEIHDARYQMYTKRLRKRILTPKKPNKGNRKPRRWPLRHERLIR